MNFDNLLPRLYQDDNLKPEEYEKIHRETPLGCRIVSLLVITENKGKEGVKGLIQSLEREQQHKGHKELAAELKQGLYVYYISVEVRHQMMLVSKQHFPP